MFRTIRNWIQESHKPEIWTERMICLYERQIAAREALGEKYCCHPSNDVRAHDLPRLRVIK